MIWAQLLAYVTGTVDQELLLRNEYLVAENRILKAQIKGRLLLSEEEVAAPDARMAFVARNQHARVLLWDRNRRSCTGDLSAIVDKLSPDHVHSGAGKNQHV